MSTIDQQFIEYIVKSLVSKPDAVVIQRRIDEKGVLLELTVDADDLGRVIGKRGATAQSLRTLLRALGTKNEARYNLKIVDVIDGVPMGHPTNYAAQNEVRSDENTPQEQNEPIEKEPKVEAVADEPIGTEEDTNQAESDFVSKTRKELEEFDD